MLRTIIIGLLTVILCAESNPGKSQSTPSNTVDSILWWLPEDTETVVVTRGPFTVVDSKRESNNLKETLERLSYGPLFTIQHGKLLKTLVGQTILLSVEGSRKFRPPTELGSVRYEGCHILVFGEEFAATRSSFIESLESHAKGVQKIAGHEVTVFEEKWERDLWKVFIVSPNPNVLLCATDQGFLTDLLNRMESKGKGRALPESLPEWKQADTTAPFWAVRHYDKENAAKDPTSPLLGRQGAANAPDKQAIGITLAYNPKLNSNVIIKYLSANKKAATIANQFWNPDPYKLNSKISTSEPGIVKIVVSPDNPAAFPILLLVLLSAVGHAIYI